MTEDPDDGAQTPADPSEAFARIGNETRAAILQALGQDPHAGISFSELRSRVDPDMDSGQFNYHLDKLVGHFVVDGDDGYELHPAGLSLYRAIRAGSFDRRTTREAFEAGFDCYFCETAVAARYEDGMFLLQCPGCDHEYTHTRLPPSAVEDVDERALLELVSDHTRHELSAHVRGVCPICVNPLTQAFVPGADVWTDGADRFDWWVKFDCNHCGRAQYTSIGMVALFEPQVIAFFHDHGVDVTRRPYWEFEFVMTDHRTTILETDPFAAELKITHEGNNLTLAVDDSLTYTPVDGD